jgi:hypothetical protein
MEQNVYERAYTWVQEQNVYGKMVQKMYRRIVGKFKQIDYNTRFAPFCLIIDQVSIWSSSVSRTLSVHAVWTR